MFYSSSTVLLKTEFQFTSRDPSGFWNPDEEWSLSFFWKGGKIRPIPFRKSRELFGNDCTATIVYNSDILSHSQYDSLFFFTVESQCC